MPPPLDPELKAAILEAIKAGENPCASEIARKHGVAQSTVSKIARDAKLGGAFDRSKTKKATTARVLDGKAARSIEAIESITVAAALRQKIITAKDARDARDFATAYGIMSDKHMAYDRYDSDNGADEARSMLGALAAGLQVAYEQLPPEQ